MSSLKQFLFSGCWPISHFPFSVIKPETLKLSRARLWQGHVWFWWLFSHQWTAKSKSSVTVKVNKAIQQASAPLSALDSPLSVHSWTIITQLFISQAASFRKLFWGRVAECCLLTSVSDMKKEVQKTTV